MDFLIIVFIIVAIVNVIQKKKKQEAEAARRRQAAQMAADASGGAAPVAQAAQRPVKAAYDPRFPDLADDDEAERRAALAAQRQAAEASARARREAEALAAKAAAARAARPIGEGESRGGSLITVTAQQRVGDRMQESKGRRHTLEASSITGHSHMESSMTGGEQRCMPDMTGMIPRSSDDAPPTVGVRVGGFKLAFDRESIVGGVLYSEILGKPKALRR